MTKLKVPKFKRGDWCFCEFKLQQVMETNEDRITSVSDGYFRLGSSDLTDRCYPLELDIKCISGEVEYWRRKLHELKNNSLNHPDLNRELIERWCNMCDDKDDHDKLKKHYENLAEFCNAVIKRVEELDKDRVGGIRIFR